MGSKGGKKKRVANNKEKAALKNKLTKLKELYVNDLIDIEEYKKDYEIYTSALNQIPIEQEEKRPDFESVKKLLTSDFKELYNTLTREEKRSLWRSVIKEIRIDNECNVTGISFG